MLTTRNLKAVLPDSGFHLEESGRDLLEDFCSNFFQFQSNKKVETVNYFQI